MEFDKYNGPVFLTTPDGKKIVPILSVERDFLIGATFCARMQFPLIVCYAITVHKSQSITEDMIVTDLSCQDFQTGLSYMAVSRVETLEGLMLEAPFDRNHLVYGSPPDGMKMKMRDQELRKRQVLTQNPYMSHNTKNCHGNRSYYTLSDQTPVYAAALLLDPSKRRKYIERNWQESWHAPAIAAAQQIWLDEYNAAPIPESLRVPLDVSSSSGRQHNELDELLSDIAVTGPILDDADDFETFIDAPPTRITGSPLQWWLHRDQRKAYPRLSRMAIDILSIPPESSDVESHFSSARRTLSWDRESMTCENLAKVECVGNWMREGIIVSKSHGGRGVISSVAVEFSVETEAEDFLD
ncbi:hypothetical protein FOMA001_g16900 [Fusarium oxysporum f. sp. matthiolae]|nr:hypothetical protein FOMA001_g16900 [Fusarium oxysporum f. sp. matthiolae]